MSTHSVEPVSRRELLQEQLGHIRTPETDPLEGTITDQEPLFLVLDGTSFPCRPDLKLGFLLRSAKNGLEGLHDIVTHAVPEEYHGEMFDITDEMGLEEIGDAVGDLVKAYTDRPTQSSSPSSAGSRHTARR